MRTAIVTPATGLIRRFEGLGDGSDAPGLQPYMCPAGKPTLGWGSIYSLDGKRVTMAHPTIHETDAELLMLRDVKRAYRAVARLVKVPMTDEQAAAVIDFVYNLGSGNFRASTLRAKINRRDYDGAAAEFPRWVFSGGRKLRGLVIRRETERALWLS